MENTFDESSNEDFACNPSPLEGKGTRVAGGMGSFNQEKLVHFPVSRKTRDLLIAQAREMRKHPTNAEASLWGELRNKKLAGYRFRRQHPIGIFIVDFYCPLRKLVIEVDGPIHNKQKTYDKTREDNLKALGYTVLRFTNQQVEDDLGGVLQEILMILSK